MRRHRTLVIHPLTVLAFLATPASGVALAQGGSAEIPENAHANSYGSGWQCDYGYRAVDEACVAVQVPENGYLADFAYGPGWQCDRGYRAVDEACVAVQVPENGYLADFAYGPGWQCDRGYRAVDGACVAVQVPENAHIDLFGDGWECNPPYRKHQDRCTPPIGGNPWSPLQGV